jgi:hypothetical protein
LSGGEASGGDEDGGGELHFGIGGEY